MHHKSSLLNLLCHRAVHAWCAVCLLVIASSSPAQLQLDITVQSAPLITVTGPSGTACEVQWSDSLADPGRWFFLTNRTLASAVQVTDLAAVTGARFYRAVTLPDTGMVLVPGGTFAMGDTFAEGFTNERPVHTVTVSSFYMERTEVRRVDWSVVYLWALDNGYNFDHDGGGKGPTHPVHTINWYDAVKWCNARSEKEGLTPAYYTDAAQTNVYRSGRLDLQNQLVRWSADGYRLPTEAEWERAARSGTNGLRFPWGNQIGFSNANYYGVTYLLYDTNGVNGFHPAYATNDFPYTSPVGSFPPTAYGLHDMAGNVWEWCWDRFEPAWYSNPLASLPDPTGSPGPTTNRVMRGGSWADDASFGRCANRAFGQFQSPASADFSIGLRCVKPLPGFLGPSLIADAAMLPDGQFRFTIYNLTPGKTNIVETSANLGSWSAVATNVSDTAVLDFTNAAPSATTGRYFRNQQLP